MDPRTLGERVGEEGQQLVPVAFGCGLVVDREVSHRPSVQRVGIDLAAVIHAGVA